MHAVPTLDDIRAARSRIEPYAIDTPLIPSARGVTTSC